jgi:hypothetical protein
LASALENVSNTSLMECDPELTPNLLKLLNMENIEDLKENLLGMKVKTIKIDFFIFPAP